MQASGPNAEQVRYWNEQSGPKWVAQQERLDRMIAPYGRAAMDALDLGAGERVIDVGCGCGDTTLELARRVGTSGGALGVDVSEPMLARARERARAADLANVSFMGADAQTHAFAPASADALFSRFGVMFFADATAAFANLRRALRPGGRLGFTCWQALAENPWVLVPLMAAAKHVQLPPPPAPDAPGPFSFADGDRVRRILSDAGFARVDCESFASEIVVMGGGGLGEAVEFVLQLGPTGAVLRDAGPDALARVAEAVHEALTPYVTARGVVMPSAGWTVTAR